MKNKDVFFIYWCSKDTAIVKNINYCFHKQGFNIKRFSIDHLQYYKIGQTLGVRRNFHPLNLIFLFGVFLYLNIRVIFHENVYILGPNSAYAALFPKKNLVVHYNEVPSFIENKIKTIKSRLDYLIFSQLTNVVVSNRYRLRLLKKLSHNKKNFFTLDNILYLDTKKNAQNIEKTNKTDTITLLFTGLINSKRMINELVCTVGSSTRFNLKLAGRILIDDTHIIDLIEKYPNVEYLGQLSHKETMEVVENKCDIGVAFYTLDSINNKYCAPLKIHEYFHFDKSVITLKNPPLLSIEKSHNIIITLENISELVTDTIYQKINNQISNSTKKQYSEYQNKAKSEFLHEFNKITLMYK